MVKNAQGSIEYIYLIGGVLIVAFVVVILMISLVDDPALVFPDFIDDRLPGVHCGDGQIEWNGRKRHGPCLVVMEYSGRSAVPISGAETAAIILKIGVYCQFRADPGDLPSGI